MRVSIDGVQCLAEGAHATHVSIQLCPPGKSCPPIILHGPELSLKRTAGSLVCSLGSLMVVVGAFLFEQLLDFLICFVKPVLVFSGRQADNFSRGVL